MKLLMMVSLIAMALVSCATPAPRRSARPCGPVIPPIRYNNLIVVINYNYSYNARDPNEARAWHKGDIIAHLNSLGQQDGNTFAESNGQPVNFYLTYTLNNDGQDHFTGSINLSGWGQGHIATMYSGQYPYASSAKLTSDLTDKAYGFIHTGWHDARPGCPQG